jgi:enoyl-CoA hydratase/carnithine racemase
MGYETITTELRDGILEIMLNRPEKRNAINDTMETEFNAALDAAEMDPEVQVVTLKGSGQVFSAGHDLKGQPVWPAIYPNTRPSAPLTLPRAWYFRKPLIAGVHEYVGPYAMAYVACCDSTIASRGTRFSLEALRAGAHSQIPYGPWAVLYTQLPMKVITKLFLVGGWMDAEEANRHQFVQRVVDRSELDAETQRWAEEAREMSSPKYAEAKHAVRRVYETMCLSWAQQIPGPATGAGFEAGFKEQNVMTTSEWRSVWDKQGLQEALRVRDEKFDVEVGRVTSA